MKAAILELFATPNNTYGAIGSTVFAGSFYGPAGGVAPNVQVVTVNVGIAANPDGIEVPTRIDQYPYVPVDGSTIQVVVA